jgi:hypothetical protein
MSGQVIASRGVSYWLSAALGFVALAAAASSFFVRDVLGGPAVAQGNLRGTAVVIMVLVLPSLAVSMKLTSRGSARALVVWFASVAYLLYQAVLFVFATPFNSLFLVYVAMLSLSLWSSVALAHQTDVAALSGRFDRLPARAIAAYAGCLAFLNMLAWLRTIVPAILADEPDSFLDGSGAITNVVFVQDLAVWLPVLAVSAWWLWHGQPWGQLMVGAILTLVIFEGIGVACDQWFGVMADPNTPFASTGAIPFFLGLVVVGSIPLFFYYRSLDRKLLLQTPKVGPRPTSRPSTV